jgi:hypothetical protein
MRNRNKKTHKKKTFNKRKPKNTVKKNKATRTKKRKIVKGGEKERENECAVCYEELNNQDNPDITLSCQHTFHRTCMINTCRHMRSDCTCPLCRTVLTPQDLNVLRIATPPPPPLPELPYLDSIDEFRTYINNKLRAPTRNPLEKLEKALYEFVGTDRLPYEIFDDIMEFELQQIGPLYRYRFLGIVRQLDVPRNHVVNKKYFRYINYEIARHEDWADLDEFEHLDHDEESVYAYHVYDVL